jgi:hypothetical protein
MPGYCVVSGSTTCVRSAENLRRTSRRQPSCSLETGNVREDRTGAWIGKCPHHRYGTTHREWRNDRVPVAADNPRRRSARGVGHVTCKRRRDFCAAALRAARRPPGHWRSAGTARASGQQAIRSGMTELVHRHAPLARARARRGRAGSAARPGNLRRHTSTRLNSTGVMNRRKHAMTAPSQPQRRLGESQAASESAMVRQFFSCVNGLLDQPAPGRSTARRA